MHTARVFLRSPLARHPGLLGRKLASRLGLYREETAVPAPTVSSVAYPEQWGAVLREWVGQVPLHPGPHSFARQFGQDFDESLLLRLCREGPRSGERGLTGDLKLAWEYSRGQPLVPNAAAGGSHLDICTTFLRRWLEANADFDGTAWGCAMEVAIRAVNWIFADVLFGEKLSQDFGQRDWAAWLWRHGCVIWRRLEARLVSSNHYLADLLGLLVIGSVFPDDAHARRWHRFALAEFPHALLAQTRADGGLAEASLRYHAYVTEMALLFRLAQGGAFGPAAEARLRDMCRIVADFRDATGDLFAIGDDDSGRVLALDFVSPQGRAEILLRLATLLLREKFPGSASAVYPASGWWLCRAGEFAVALDFGGVGMQGMGGHAHNDDFSFCLDWRGKTVIADPGTFRYTSDPAARNRFRSTVFHNTLVIDGREQRELVLEPFRLTGSDRAFVAARAGKDAWVFTRKLAPGLWHRREVSVRRDLVLVRDHIEGSGQHHLRWHFHLHPGVEPKVIGHQFALIVKGAGTLLVESSLASVALEIEETDYSPGYGRSQRTYACNARGDLNLPLTAEWTFRPLNSQAST